MAFEETYYARMSLQKFVEEQMLPDDLVAIIKTSRGSATLQAFTSDKRELLSRIDTIQWTVYNDLPAVPRAVDDFNNHKSQLISINYCIKALRGMPGRKFLMLMTHNAVGPSSLSLTYDNMADAALRAGVVVHTMDIGGLTYRPSGSELARIPLPTQTLGSPLASLVSFPPTYDYMDSVSRRFDSMVPSQEYTLYRSMMGSEPLPLSRKTGGLYLEDNFFVDGIGDLEEEMKGYYLLSYIPPENSFSKSGRNRYHNIEIRVRRKGATVHTRDGFFGEPAVLEAPAAAPPPLVEAMFSPFRYNDLNVTLASGYVDNLKKGYLLPTWMYLDGRDLSIVRYGSRYLRRDFIQESGPEKFSARLEFRIHDRSIQCENQKERSSGSDIAGHSL